MGCKWPKFRNNEKVFPISKSAEHSIPPLDDAVVRPSNTGSLDVVSKQPVSNVIGYTEQNNEHTVNDGPVNQFIPIPLENLKPLVPDKSTKDEMSTHETTNEHPSKRMNSETPDKRPISGNGLEEANDPHGEKFNDETASTSNKSIVEEDIDITPKTTEDQIQPEIDGLVQDSTVSVSKRIDFGTSGKHSLSSYNNHPNDLVEDDIVSISDASVVDATINALPAAVNNHVEIVDADPEAFNTLFIKQRQDAIDNPSYRSIIKSWQPRSLQQLIENIGTLLKGKSLIDCHWIIFYWIACNIEYDAVSFLNDNVPGQSEEEVFRTKMGVCAGYSGLYKYLCDQLGIKCEKVHGYAKGYGFDNREQGAPLKKDHAWNVVEINHHWYLMDSTWGTGHLTQQKIFERKLDCFYFLVRPHQIIYHHLPDDDKWQLLRTPIKMTQYMQMPNIRPPYFNLHLDLISPLHQAHLSLVRDKSYALVLIRTPADVDLIASLKLHEKNIEGGHRIVFDVEKQLYRCYFAPASTGKHKVQLFAKKANSNSKSYEHVLEFTLNIDELPKKPVSYPTTWKEFYDLDLKVLSPVNTHLIKVCSGATHARVIIRAPNDVALLGNLKDSDGTEVEGGNQVYYDPQKCLWKCKFAPDRDGLFEANIFGKKKSDTGNYSLVVSFNIQASDIPSTPLSYPHTWQIFHELHLKVKAPQNCASVTWSENASYVEILIQAPDDVQLSCTTQHNNVDVKNGSLAQYDNEKRLWQLLFAPECTGQHELTIFAKRLGEETSECALKFHLNVTQLRRSMKFPIIYSKFHATRCRIYEPFNGVLKKGATVPIHCIIPGASEVSLTVDSKWIKTEGYQDPILKQNVTVGSKEVTICASYEQKSTYESLIKYSVQGF